MATVEIEFNCLCLFAADAPGAVHVLMPKTGDGHVHGHAMDPHVVRLYQK
ncbi:MAG: hypothetical protein JO306_12435, partial [Gemmatimonadetes bacterium]|nr:hypothetical protein [Gemmatimonadota bacterium]